MIVDQLICLAFGHVWVEDPWTRNLRCDQCDAVRPRRLT